MKKKFKYGTVSEAVANLREKGFDKDFQIKGSQIEYDGNLIDAGELKIVVIYRYEGDSDPGDEASVYGIETTSGLKGILVTTDGAYSDAASAQFLKKLHTAKNKGLQK